LYATVVETDGADVLLEIAPDVVCRFSRGAIARVVGPQSGEHGEHEGHGSSGEHDVPDDEPGHDGGSAEHGTEGATGVDRTGDAETPKPPKKEL
jgi:preprotein translocase subunit YajC